MTPLLSAREISFHYGERAVLDRLSFDLAPGASSALIGSNGAGKTTLLRILTGTLKASGAVLLDGQPLAERSAKERARLVALVPQQLDMPFDFTVEQVVEQGRTPHLGLLRGLSTDDRVAIEHAMQLTDVAMLRHRIFNELSGGERQRVKIALGLAQQPRLLLLDEPTQNLDIGRQAELIDLLHDLNVQGITIFSSIHDLHLVANNFSQVVLLGPGQEFSVGSVAETMSAKKLAHAFQCPPGRHPLLMEAAS